MSYTNSSDIHYYKYTVSLPSNVDNFTLDDYEKLSKVFQLEAADMDGDSVKTVNARAIWSYLESKQDFSTWVKGRIEKGGFVENEDYLLHKFMEQLPSGAKAKIDYYCTLDMAKHLGLMEGNAKGKIVRKYFVFCDKLARRLVEERVKTVTNPLEVSNLNARLDSLEAELLEVKKNNTKPKLSKKNDGNYSFTQVCELLNLDAASFRPYMVEHNMVSWDGDSWWATPYMIDNGLMVTKTGYNREQHKRYQWSLFTPLGLSKLTDLLLEVPIEC